MKKIFTLALVATLSLLSATSFARTPAQEQRQVARGLKVKDNQLESKIKEKALREARVEARKLTKQGFVVAAGMLPLDRQLEQAWKHQYDVDQDGNRLYIIASQTAIGGSLAAAKTQATALAKIELAGQIATEVAALVETQVSNEELGQQEAATIVNTISASKQKIQQNLGRIIPVVEISRTLANKNVEVQITIAYNTQNALTIVKQAIKEDLRIKGDKLADELDKIL